MNANPVQIKKAFGRLAKMYHPDQNPEEIEKFNMIKTAYEILTDPLERTKVDKKLQQFSQDEKSEYRQQNPFFKAQSQIEKDLNDQMRYAMKEEEVRVDYEDVFPSFKYSSQCLLKSQERRKSEYECQFKF